MGKQHTYSTRDEENRGTPKKKRKRRRSSGDKILGALIILTLMGIAVLAGAILGKVVSNYINI